MSEPNDKLTGHDYDGIQEYDNPMPTWWLAIFIGTVGFAFLYWIHYELGGGGQTQLAELKTDLTKIQSSASQLGRPASTESEEEYARLVAQAETINSGKSSFVAKCAACHGDKLQGIIGPNLVDEFWINGKGKLTEISQTVRKGVPEKGMPAWEMALKDDEIKSIVAYIGSQKGTKPENPKAPQGAKVE